MIQDFASLPITLKQLILSKVSKYLMNMQFLRLWRHEYLSNLMTSGSNNFKIKSILFKKQL